MLSSSVGFTQGLTRPLKLHDISTPFLYTVSTLVVWFPWISITFGPSWGKIDIRHKLFVVETWQIVYTKYFNFNQIRKFLVFAMNDDVQLWITLMNSVNTTLLLYLQDVSTIATILYYYSYKTLVLYLQDVITIPTRR